MKIPNLNQATNNMPIGGYRFLDKVRVICRSRLIALPSHHAALLFDGHEGYVVGQFPDQSYNVWFKVIASFGYAPPVCESFHPENLEFICSQVPSSMEQGAKQTYVPDVLITPRNEYPATPDECFQEDELPPGPKTITLEPYPNGEMIESTILKTHPFGAQVVD